MTFLSDMANAKHGYANKNSRQCIKTTNDLDLMDFMLGILVLEKNLMKILINFKNKYFYIEQSTYIVD